MEPIPIKMEVVTPPRPTMPLLQHPVYGTQYSQYASACDLSVEHQQNPYASSSYLGGAGTNAHGSKQPADDALKRQIYLRKNREAAKEWRQKRKVYFKYLEHRVVELESQNQSLKEQLIAIKQYFRLQ
ncbi:cyclic AMP response element-binding protein B-like [Eucyclogobius newberryi]|uniref:cyclic AMP response element-binding protein B-like n=1 Tax=Eucyclogobius newberryi TaxID=166745 RepID=UPI003B5C10E5